MFDRFLNWLDKKLENSDKIRQAVSAVVMLLVSGLIVFALVFVAGGWRGMAPGTGESTTLAPEQTTGDVPPETSAAPDGTETADVGTTAQPENTTAPTPGTTQIDPPETTPAPSPVVDRPVQELIAEGYGISWGKYDADTFIIARVPLPAAQKQLTLGDKTVSVTVPLTYEDGGIQFRTSEDRVEKRNAVEVYMGYIIMDTGRKDESGEELLTVCDPLGRVIGTYPASFVVPAYTRDSADRPLFLRGEAYFFLDPQSGEFVPSDYIDEVDGRGLYFDYNPDFGKSDSSLQIFHTEQTVKMTYEMNMSSYLTRYGVDYRIARQFMEKYPAYAEAVARELPEGGYYNKLFHIFYEYAAQQIVDELNAGIYLPLPQEFPWEREPEESGEDTAPEDTLTPEESTEGTIPELPDIPDIPEIPELPEIPDVTEKTTGGDGLPGSTSPENTETDAVPEETGTETEPVTPTNPKTATVSAIFNAYRFIYAKTRPEVKTDTVTTLTTEYTPYITQTIAWQGQYRHAKAYNFSEGRAVTVTDNGIIRVINTGGGSAIYLYRIFKADATLGGAYMTEFYIEPFDRDVTMLGYYYYDNGLMRLRKCTRLSHVINKYNEDRDVLVDVSGKEYVIPEGYTLVSYSEGVLLLTRGGRYGYYHKDGYWLAQPVYTYAQPFVEGVGVLGTADGLRGAIDKNGNVVIPFEYTEVSNASSGIFACFHPERGWEILAKMTKTPAEN